MALESKPLFHPEVIRQQVRAFSLRERVGEWQPKLQHWAGLITSGRADEFKETALLPDFVAASTPSSTATPAIPGPSGSTSAACSVPLAKATSASGV
jgi:hypothetical protein